VKLSLFHSLRSERIDGSGVRLDAVYLRHGLLLAGRRQESLWPLGAGIPAPGASIGTRRASGYTQKGVDALRIFFAKDGAGGMVLEHGPLIYG
jgi:hypothetical protein